MKSRANVAVQHKSVRLDGFYLKGFHYQQPNDLKLLCFLRFCRIKGSESVYRALEGINIGVSGNTLLWVAEVSSVERHAEDLASELNDVMWRNTGGLFVKVGYREFPDHHYRQFAPEVCCRKFLA